MEADILKALKFELGGPTVKTFLRHVCFIDFILLVLNGLVVVPCFFLACWLTANFCVCRRFSRVAQEGVDVSLTHASTYLLQLFGSLIAILLLYSILNIYFQNTHLHADPFSFNGCAIY